MTRLSLLAASAAIATLAGGAAWAQLPETLVIATEGAYPPWNATLSGGTLQGFDVDLGVALCRELAIDCTFVAQDWSGIIPALQAGRYDLIIASMSITEEREEAVDFSNPYADIYRRFAVLADSPLLEHATWEEMLPELQGVPAGANRRHPTADQRTDRLADPAVALDIVGHVGQARGGEQQAHIGIDLEDDRPAVLQIAEIHAADVHT
ncbi:MAG: transporter substrate-binding domain-containing protein [Azospirillaceae bacterium]